MDDGKDIKKVLSGMLRVYGLEDRYFEYELLAVWEDVLGKMIAKHTIDLRLKYSVLYVKIDSASIRHELSLMRTKLMERLNENFERKIIKEIRIN